MMRDNHLPRSGSQERLDAVAEELDRLGREELPQIEPLLTDALKEKQLAGGQTKTEPGKRDPLNEALGHQEEVEKTLSDLLARLEPWSTTREVKGETRALLEEERKLEAQAAKLSREVPAGTDPKALTPEQRAELDKVGDWQERVGERLNKLLDKMGRVAQDKTRQALEKRKQAELLELQAGDKEKRAEKLKAKDPRGCSSPGGRGQGPAQGGGTTSGGSRTAEGRSRRSRQGGPGRPQGRRSGPNETGRAGGPQ